MLQPLGHAIEMRRAELRLSQADIARRASMHQNYVGAIERGDVNPTYHTLVRLSVGLDLRLSELIALAEAKTEVPAPRRRT